MITRNTRRFRTPSNLLLEPLELRLLRCGDITIDPPPDDSSSNDNPPADTQPVDTQPSGSDTQPSDNNSNDNSSSDDNSSDDGSSDSSSDDDNTPPIIIIYPPARPTNLTLQSPSPSTVFLTWSEPSKDADFFQISRLDPNGHWRTIATVNGDTTRYTDTHLPAGTHFSYSIVALNDGGYSEDSRTASITIHDASDPTLVGTFGHIPGGPFAAPLTFLDQDGTQITISLTGPGLGSLRLTPNGYDLSLAGTTLASAVKIKTTKTKTPSDDGRFTLDSLTVGNPANPSDHTPLGSLTAATTDLTNSLSLAGPASSLSLGNLLNTTLHTGGAAPKTKSPNLSLTVNNITDSTLAISQIINKLKLATASNSSLTTAAISTLTAQRWLTGSITATTINSLTLSNATATNTLNLTAISLQTLTIDGALANSTLTLTQPLTKRPALNKLTIHNQLLNSQFRTTANIGTLVINTLNHSLIFAGISPSLSTLPTLTTDFITRATISTLTIANSLINSNIAAAAITHATLKTATDQDQSAKFGFATLIPTNPKNYHGPRSLNNFISPLNAQLT